MPEQVCTKASVSDANSSNVFWHTSIVADVAVALAAAAAKEEAGAYNGDSYAASSAHLGGHPNYHAGTKRVQAQDRWHSSDLQPHLCVCPQGSGQDCVWDRANFHMKFRQDHALRLGLCTWDRCDLV